MIITSQKALRLVSNHEIVRVIPELLVLVEEYKSAEKIWASKQGCSNCKKAEYFEGVELKAVKAIQALPRESIDKLKKFMGATELYLNLPNPGKKGQIVRLDP